VRLTRRALLWGTATVAISGPAIAGPDFVWRARTSADTATPVPIAAVRLRPSIFADALAANRSYLVSLDPERLLHNFYHSAGLEAPKPAYGGWEAMGIAGHSLGHWLSAASILIANTGDFELASKLDHTLAEMARIQSVHGDGYCGGTTVERNGKIVDGKVVFEEVRRGEISSHGFDLNGGWVPLYTWHKVHAGLIDAHRLAGNPRAMPVLLGIAGYLADVLEGLDDDQIQRVLAAEYGGLNETYADTYALTDNPRWLRLAQRFYHRAVLDPVVAGVDRLDGLHANTQIPKVIGLARIHELTGQAPMADAARFFHHTVVHHHSYAIGGNSDREHFGPPDRIADRITDATCEACNSYNMLKLTRHLYQWAPDASLFDYYERAQINHIMAHQNPADGRFVYFMPLAAGARRTFSDPEDSFWCCVGSGMESHAKHADSIFWTGPNTLYVNLYIPSELDLSGRGLTLVLDSAMPHAGNATLTVLRAPKRRHTIALRLPAWADKPTIALNGTPVTPVLRGGYAMIERNWRKGDTIELTLPMSLRTEPTPDDPSVISFAYGPLVLAADLGPAAEPYEGIGPALIAGTVPQQEVGSLTFVAEGALGERLNLSPFYSQYDRRSAVYFPTFNAAEWAGKRDQYLHAQRESLALAQRTVDTLYLGEMQPERDHSFVPGKSEVVNWNGRSARRLFAGSTMSMTLARHPGPSILRLTVFSGDAAHTFAITVDGKPLDNPWPKPGPGDRFVALDFPLPNFGVRGRDKAVIDISAIDAEALLYEVRMMTASVEAGQKIPT